MAKDHAQGLVAANENFGPLTSIELCSVLALILSVHIIPKASL